MNRIFNPPHPGDTLRDDVLPALGLTVTEAASQLGVTRAALSRILHGHAGISPEMAPRLEAWLGEENGGGPICGSRSSRPTICGGRARDGPPANVFRRGQYRLGSPAGRVLKRLWTQ